MLWQRRSIEKTNAWQLYLVNEREDDNTENEKLVIPFNLCLTCSSCSSVCFATDDDVLEDIIPHSPESAFNYDLDILSKQVKCYSATNPAADRFDVIRLSKDVAFVFSDDEYSTSHSWFPGYSWTAAGCLVCCQFLGWKFRNTLSPEEEFFGLIVTKLRPRTITDVICMPICDIEDVSVAMEITWLTQNPQLRELGQLFAQSLVTNRRQSQSHPTK